VRRYVPDAGDLVWLTFDPQAGSEQAGRRPALVVTPRSYNDAAGLAVMCPVTSRVKGYPFEVALGQSGGVTGVVLADHVKSLDWRARDVTLISHVPDAVLAEARAKLRPLLGLG
jgi:mRNA interferase MazF